MIRKICFFAALVAALALVSTDTDAKGRHHKYRSDQRIKAVGLVVGAASTATYFALNDWRWKWNNNNGSGLTSLGAYAVTSAGCMVVAPIVATVVVDRPLTMREVHVLAGGCIVPIVGGWIVDKIWDAHPEWEPAAAKPMKLKTKHRMKHKKMA